MPQHLLWNWADTTVTMATTKFTVTSPASDAARDDEEVCRADRIRSEKGWRRHVILYITLGTLDLLDHSVFI